MVNQSEIHAITQSHHDTHHIYAFLEHQGFRVKFDAEGDIVFPCEGLVYLLCFDPHDPEWARLVVPFVWSDESEANCENVARAIGFINRRSKIAKAYVENGRVSLCVQLPLVSIVSLTSVLLRCIRALSEARTMLINVIRFPGVAMLDQERLAGDVKVIS